MKLIFSFMACLLFCGVYGQVTYDYEPSQAYPYGRPHPEAPSQVRDFQGMIGKCQCKSVSRISQTEWADTVAMTWTFKYIMNGWAVQDETLKSDGVHSGSIRQFNPDSSLWYVHYYSSGAATPVLSAWEGDLRENGNIVLYRDQTAPNGMEGFYRITFHQIRKSGFDWVGEWVDQSETITYPMWKIFCKRDD